MSYISLPQLVNNNIFRITVSRYYYSLLKYNLFFSTSRCLIEVLNKNASKKMFRNFESQSHNNCQVFRPGRAYVVMVIRESRARANASCHQTVSRLSKTNHSIDSPDMSASKIRISFVFYITAGMFGVHKTFIDFTECFLNKSTIILYEPTEGNIFHILILTDMQTY